MREETRRARTESGYRLPLNLRRIDTAPKNGSGATRGWQAVFTRHSRQRTKFFADSKYGGPEGARGAATSWVEDELRRVDPESPRLMLFELEQLRRENEAMRRELIELRGSKCIRCGCTDLFGCDSGCSWHTVDDDRGEGVCSNCVDRAN